MKRLILTFIFKPFKKSTFLASLSQNTCPVYDSEEIRKQEQKKLLKDCIHNFKITTQTTLTFPSMSFLG